MDRKKKFKLAKIQAFTVGLSIGGTIGMASRAIAQTVSNTVKGQLASYLISAAGMCVLAAPVVSIYNRKIADWATEPDETEVELITEINP